MKRITLMATLISITFTLACEKPEPKEKTPEHEACIERAETYFKCKMGEVSGAGEAVEKQVNRMVEGNRRRANTSLEKCESVLAKVKPDDSCQP